MRAATVTTLLRRVRFGLFAIVLAVFPLTASAAPYAAYVMDARTGETLYSQNADTRLNPASLTKMMTLYLAFQAIESGKVSLDSTVTVTAHAANMPPSRLGLRPGQKIQLRYLIRAAAVKSANDAAAAIGDYLGGDEEGFAVKMNATAARFGMKNTTFRNENGLTRAGHLSSAHDMALLARHLIYDFPQYYNLFSRRTADAGIANVASTNRKFLDSYEGADGIKTGYTVAAGFNLAASAVRGDKRIIGVIFGGTSTAQRNSKMADLLDMGFSRAPNNARSAPPKPPLFMAKADDVAGPEVTDNVQDDGDEGEAAPAVIAAAAPATSLRPAPRPAFGAADAAEPPVPAPAPAVALAEAQPAATPEPAPATIVAAEAAVAPAPRPTFVQTAAAQPETLAMIQNAAPAGAPVFVQSAQPQPETAALAQSGGSMLLAAMSPPAPSPKSAREVVVRASTSGGRNWGVSIGNYNSKYAAERALLTTALTETDTLSGALRKIATRKTGFEAMYVGLTQDEAQLACARLTARASDCTVIGQ